MERGGVERSFALLVVDLHGLSATTLLEAGGQTHTDESMSETRADGRRRDERRRRGAPPPAVAVVQLAIETHAWVIDALGDGRDALAKLLSWMLQNESVVVLGFAFAGDLVVLKPLCGEVDARNLVDLQTLARRWRQRKHPQTAPR